MDKVLGIIVAAAVLMFTALTTLAMVSDSLSNFGDDTSNTEAHNCNFQIEQASNDPDRLDNVSPECRDEAEERVGRSITVDSGIEALMGED